MAATRAARRSLSPKRISEVATVSFSLMTGTAPQLQQGGEGRAGVEMAPPVLRIVEGEQDLGHGDAVAGKGLLIGMGEADLARGRRRLLLLQPQRARGEAEMAPADGDGAGGDQDHLLALRPERGHVIGQGLEPAPADIAALLLDQQGGADLDDDPPGPGQAGGGRRPRPSGRGRS